MSDCQDRIQLMIEVEDAAIGQSATDKQLVNFSIRYGKITKKRTSKY